MKNYFSSLTPFVSMPLRHITAASMMLVCMSLASSPLRAAVDEKEVGTRLLKAELPNGTNLKQVECEILAKAVRRATAAHKANAAVILDAALSNGSIGEALRKEDRRSCECITRIVRASFEAAPEQASSVLDVALALYPDCADTLGSILDAPVAGINNLGATGDGGIPSGPSAGFPGSPGFGGSTPGGGIALPPPLGVAVTATVNE